jgi:tetratricopeptide (TPR) repeat protein
LTRRRRRTSAR